MQKSNPAKSRKIAKIIKDNKKVIIKIVNGNLNERDAHNKEQQLIEHYGRRCTRTGILTNILRGGEGHTCDDIPVCQYTLLGEFVAEYKNAKEAAAKNGWKYNSMITGCCRGRERSYKRFLWAYKNKLPKLRSSIRPVYQWSFEGKLLNIFVSCTAASKTYNCDPSTIIDAANGKIRQALGYLWSYQNVSPTLRKSYKKKQVIHKNTGIIYESVSAASRDINIINTKDLCFLYEEKSFAVRKCF